MNCKIYKIVCNITGQIYVGSTKLTLKQRICLHITNNNNPNNSNCSSSIILNNNNWCYELIENCDINNKKERERYYINNIENCINELKLNWTPLDLIKANKKHRDSPARKHICY